ncbi:hypothetical protein ACYOEI_05105 [Singulisphaera rosea]
MGKLDGTERILGSPAEALRQAGWFSGLLLDMPRVETILEHLLTEATFRPRTEQLERDSTWKQLIPYGVLTSGGRVFAYRRSKMGGEARLHAKASIGIGGHVNQVDSEYPDLFQNRMTLHSGMVREIAEEMALSSSCELRLIGLIHDDTDEVGSVHLGVIYEVRVASEEPAGMGPEIAPIGWVDPRDLVDAKGMNWESWSGLLVDQWIPTLAASLAQSST